MITLEHFEPIENYNVPKGCCVHLYCDQPAFFHATLRYFGFPIELALCESHASELEKLKLDNQPILIFVGSNTRRIYHIAACQNARRILPDNVIVFESKEDAINQGYRGCGTCMYDEPTYTELEAWVRRRIT